MNQVIHIGFMEMAGKRPGTELSPVMQHSHFRTNAVGPAFLVEFTYGTEFIRHLLYIIAEIRIAFHQMEIASQPDPLDRLPKKGPSHTVPVFFRLQCGVSAVHKGRRAAQSHREQIRMKPQLMGIHLHPCAEPGLEAGEHALDQPVKTEFLKPSVIRLDSHPAVIIKNIGFFAVFMYHINQLPAEGNYKIIDKFHPVRFFPAARHMGHMQFSLVDEVLGSQFIAIFRGKIIQCLFAHREIIGTPVRKKVPVPDIASPYPNKIIKHGSKTHNSSGRMGFTPLLHPLQEKFLCLRVNGINLHQVLFIPIVGSMVVHGNFFPDTIGHKAHRIGVPCGGLLNGHTAFFLIVTPFIRSQQRIRGSVIYLPVPERPVAVIDGKLLLKKILHQLNGEFPFRRHRRACHKEALLQLIMVLLRPLIMFPDHTDSGVNPISRIQYFIGKLRPVTVTDDIRPPFFRQLQSQLFVA